MFQQDDFPFAQDYDWKTKIFLGEGSYGKVFKVKNIKDGEFYAIKSIGMQEFHKDSTLMDSLKAEILITESVKSPFSVKMCASQIGYHHTYMILELCDSDLRKQLASRKITEPQCVEIFDQIMKGFQVLVGMGYIHRDIKPANVLVKKSIHKLADFGFACKADILGRKKITDICGTPIYMAPQLLRNQPYTAKSDVWSLGLMLFEMIFGYTPWPCRSLNQYLNAIYSKPLTFSYNGLIGQNTKDFIRRSLVIDQEKRMSWKQVFEHPLIKHKSQGQDVPIVKIDDYIRKITLKIQNEVNRKSVNLLVIIEKYKSQSINQATFSAIIRNIDPTATSHQIHTLFSYLDSHDSKQNGLVDWQIIEEKLLLVDFRQHNDILSRKIDDIVAILRQRKEDPNKLFDKIDTNHSGQIDYNEFKKFITEIAPKYTQQQVLKIYQLLDKDKNGLLSVKEFSQLILQKLRSGQTHHLASARGLRNLSNFVQYMKWTNKSPQFILNLGNQDNKSGLSRVEFQQLMNKIQFRITNEELDEVFQIIDKSQNGVITLDQLAEIVKKN